MSVIKIRNENGEFVDIPVIQGVQGEQGIQGNPGNDGVSITTASSGTTSQSGNYTITPITFNKSDGSNITVNVQARNGVNGQDGANGQDGQDGTSVNVIQATDENTAITLSQQNPNNIYYWSEE